jgi:hypothetical protein
MLAVSNVLIPASYLRIKIGIITNQGQSMILDLRSFDMLEALLLRKKPRVKFLITICHTSENQLGDSKTRFSEVH